MAIAAAISFPAKLHAQPGGHGQSKGPASGGPTKGGPKIKKPAAAPKAERPGADDAPLQGLDRISLPPGYVPPRDVRDEFLTTDELKFYPFKSKKEQSAKELKYNGLKITGEVREDDKVLVSDVIRWKLAEMTLKENRERAVTLRGNLVRDLRQAATAKKRDMLDFMLQTVVLHAPDLFKYHFVARLNAAILLSELNEREEDANGPAVPYVPANAPLLKLLNDEKQLEAVRMWAVKGLVRIAGVKDLKGEIKQPIVSALVAQMLKSKSPTSHAWYQMRLAEGLGLVNAIFDRNKQPVVTKALESVLVDPVRPWIVRAEAAQALGRVPHDKTSDLSTIAVDIVRLAQQMTIAYQKQPELPEWNICFFKLYLAFRPLNDTEKTQGFGLLTQIQSKSSLGAHKKSVQEAYEQILPLVQDLIKNAGKGMPAALAKINAWLKNQPKGNGVAAPGNNNPMAEKPPGIPAVGQAAAAR